MSNPKIVKLTDRLNQIGIEKGTTYRLDGDRVDLVIGTSPTVIRNIEVVGDGSSLKPGDVVNFTRVDKRPVVIVGGTSSTSTTIIQASKDISVMPVHAHTDGTDGGLLTSYMRLLDHGQMGMHSYTSNLPHDAHANLSGLRNDDHPQYASADGQGFRAAYLAERLDKNIFAGSGLMGGGQLSADQTLSVDQAYQFIWTGAQQFRSDITTHNILPASVDTYDLGSSTLPFRKAWLSELNAVLFAKNTASLIGGWLIVAKGEGTLPANVAAADTAIDFGQSMTPGDFVVFRTVLAVEYVQVGTLVSGTIYNVTRNLDGSGADSWIAGTVYPVLGHSGDGRIEFDAVDAPRVSILEQGATYNAQTERVRLGDLTTWQGAGISGNGFAMGDYAGGQYLYYTPASGLNLEGTFRTGLSPNPRIEITPTMLAGYSDATTKQFYLQSSDGKAYAGSGRVILDTNGVTLDDGNGSSVGHASLLFKSSGVQVASITGGANGTAPYLALGAPNATNGIGTNGGLVLTQSSFNFTLKPTLDNNIQFKYDTTNGLMLSSFGYNANFSVGQGLGVGLTLASGAAVGTIGYTGDLTPTRSGSAYAGYVYYPYPNYVTLVNGIALGANGNWVYSYAQMGAPSAAKGYVVRLSGQWTTVANANYLCIRPSASVSYMDIILRSQAVNISMDMVGIVRAAADGSVALGTGAGGVSASAYLVVYGCFF